MFKIGDKHYAITKNGKTYLPVRKNRKYWKEIETKVTELQYSCYKIYGQNSWLYFKGIPVVGKNIQYQTANYGTSLANSEDDLITSYEVTVTAADESSVTRYFPEYATNDVPSTRYTDGDLYHEVTKTQIVPGTPDDYTYYEDILKYY